MSFLFHVKGTSSDVDLQERKSLPCRGTEPERCSDVLPHVKHNSASSEDLTDASCRFPQGAPFTANFAEVPQSTSGDSELHPDVTTEFDRFLQHQFIPPIEQQQQSRALYRHVYGDHCSLPTSPGEFQHMAQNSRDRHQVMSVDERTEMCLPLDHKLHVSAVMHQERPYSSEFQWHQAPSRRQFTNAQQIASFHDTCENLERRSEITRPLCHTQFSAHHMQPTKMRTQDEIFAETTQSANPLDDSAAGTRMANTFDEGAFSQRRISQNPVYSFVPDGRSSSDVSSTSSTVAPLNFTPMKTDNSVPRDSFVLQSAFAAPSHANKKPNETYVSMIAKAMLANGLQRMSLSDIYSKMEELFPYYKNSTITWKNAVRHNLSINDCFVKAGHAANCRGFYWTIHPNCVEVLKHGRYKRGETKKLLQSLSRYRTPQPTSVQPQQGSPFLGTVGELEPRLQFPATSRHAEGIHGE